MSNKIEWVLLILASFSDPHGGVHQVEKTHYSSKTECHKAKTTVSETMNSVTDSKHYTIMCVPADKARQEQTYINPRPGKQRTQRNMDYYIRPPCPYEYCGDDHK